MLARNIGFLFISLINTACIAVFPQQFFDQRAHDSRSFWLSITLFLGAVLSVAGVKTAEKIGLRGRPFLHGMGLCLLVILVTLSGGCDGFSSPVLFLINQCAICFAANYLNQELDVRSVLTAGSEWRSQNDLMITALRFLGMLSAPLLFSFAAPGTSGGAAILLAGAAMLLLSTYLLTRESVILAPENPKSMDLKEPMRERVLELLSLSIYGCYCLLAASTVYLLSDLQKLADASTRGLRLISVVYGSAFVGTALVSLSRRKARLSWMVFAPISLFLVAVFVNREPGHQWVYQVSACVALGLGFALFLISYRDRLSERALIERKPGLLARYNAMPRVSSILGFFMMLALASLVSVAHQGFADWVVFFLTGFTALLLSGVLCLIPGEKRGQEPQSISLTPATDKLAQTFASGPDLPPG